MNNNSPRNRALTALRSLLEKGEWKAGERIPTEMQLSEELQVSRPTIRAALSVLEQEGLILSKGRGGRMIPYKEGAPAPHSPRPDSLMAGTICLLTCNDSEVLETYQGTSVAAVESGFSAKISETKYNFFRIHAKHVLGKSAAWFRSNLPAGVALTPEVAESPEICQIAQLLKQDGVPVVTGGQADKLPDCDAVLFNHEGGAAALTRWLIDHGCKKILPFWSTLSKRSWIAEREQGYVKAMRAAGLTPMEPIRCEFPVRPENRDDAVLEARIRLCAGYLFEVLTGKTPVDAVMLLEDSSLFPFIGASRLAGAKIGKGGIRYTGYDNFWLECWERKRFVPSGFATIDKRNRDAGETLATLLLERMANPGMPRTIRKIPFALCEY